MYKFIKKKMKILDQSGKIELNVSICWEDNQLPKEHISRSSLSCMDLISFRDLFVKWKSAAVTESNLGGGE